MKNRQMIEEQLAQAERHVTQGEDHIRRQKQVVRELELDGHAETAAKAHRLLEQFEELQLLHVIGRDRLRGELEDLGQRNDATNGASRG